MKRERVVVVIACLYLLIGIGVGAMELPRLLAGEHEAIGMEVAEALAVVIGVSLLLRQAWARWLAVAWMAFHVVIMLPDPEKALAHLALCAVVAWALFRPESRSWFHRDVAG